MAHEALAQPFAALRFVNDDAFDDGVRPPPV
jgi:hypothetical protein